MVWLTKSHRNIHSIYQRGEIINDGNENMVLNEMQLNKLNDDYDGSLNGMSGG